ncbi:MAG TPA: carboxypeptidase-like regulatory domain-containing protein [Pyrinomonadaceae bacterium]|jgi:hypothetical protein
MRIIAIALFLSLFARPLYAQECKCRAPERAAVTRAGYFEELVFEDETLYKSLRGVVHLPNDDRPMNDVLVELFTRPAGKSKKQHRIKACLTGEDGRFCFRGVSKGKCELRVSKNGGFEITHVYVVVDPKNRKSTDQEMNVILDVGK